MIPTFRDSRMTAQFHQLLIILFITVGLVIVGPGCQMEQGKRADDIRAEPSGNRLSERQLQADLLETFFNSRPEGWTLNLASLTRNQFKFARLRRESADYFDQWVYTDDAAENIDIELVLPGPLTTSQETFFLTIRAKSSGPAEPGPNFILVRVLLNDQELGFMEVKPQAECYSFEFERSLLKVDVNKVTFNQIETLPMNPLHYLKCLYSLIHVGPVALSCDSRKAPILTRPLQLAVELDHLKFRSLTLATGQSIDLPVIMPDNAELFFHWAVFPLNEAQSPEGIFTIRTQSASGKSETLFEQDISQAGQLLKQWQAVRVPIRGRTGKKVQLLMTYSGSDDASQNDTLILIGHPLLFTVRELSPETTQPNVLVLLIDTVRKDRLGMYGYDKGKTPELDRLSRSSLLFQNVTAQAPSTPDSIAALFSGRYPRLAIPHPKTITYNITFDHSTPRNKSKQNSPASEQSGLLKPQSTAIKALQPGKTGDAGIEAPLAEFFRRHGYNTYGFSTNPLISRRYAFDKGFDFFNDKLGFEKISEVLMECYPFLAPRGVKPSFVYLHLLDPHFPYKPPLDYIKMTIEQPEELFSDQSPQNQEKHYSALYDMEIRYSDTMVGHLLRIIRQQGNLDNFMVLVLSDHGEEFREHGRLFHNSSLYSEQVSVPFILSRPGNRTKMQQGIITHHVALMDVLPTLIDLLGFNSSATFNGKSLLPLLQSQENTWSGPIFSELRNLNLLDTKDLISLTRNNWKLIYTPEENKLKLFDLEHDPLELHDLADQQAERRETMFRQLAEEYLKLKTDDQNIFSKNDLVEDLKALGYIQ